MSACQTASKCQWIIGHVIAPHHPSLLVSARFGLAKVHTNRKMVEYMVLNPDINRFTHTRSTMAVEAPAISLDDHRGRYVHKSHLCTSRIKYL